MKPIILFYFLFFSVFSFGQFQSPEAKIDLPKIKFPEYILDYPKSLNKKLKKSIIDNTTKEYDENENIIKETVIEDNTTKVTTFDYKKNVLLKKETITTSDEEKIKRANERAIQESERLNYSEVAVQDVINSKNIYLAKLDRKKRVDYFSTISENKKSNGTYTRNVIDSEVLYEKNQIVEIKSKNQIEKFFYDKNLLLKKETTRTQGESKEVKSEECVYDTNKNLIAIYLKTINIFKDKITYDNYSVKDSAVYNENNKLIWQGNKKRFTTYKYDKNNNVTEQFQYYYGKEYLKEELEYENNQIVKYTRTIYIEKKDKEIEKSVSITTYKYDETRLIEHFITNLKTDYEKQSTYEYDDQKRLKKIIDSIRYSKKSNRIEHSETIFNYTPNALQVTEKYGNVKKYEFY